MSAFKLLCFVIAFALVASNPIVLKGSSPSGDTVIAISSSDPNVEKYITFNFPNESEVIKDSNSDSTEVFPKTFSTAVAGTNTSTGRAFGSFNPLFFPFFNFPLNFEGLGQYNFRPNWLKGIESYEPMGNGDVKTVTAVNDNGHMYGKVGTVTFDEKRVHKTV